MYFETRLSKEQITDVLIDKILNYNEKHTLSVFWGLLLGLSISHDLSVQINKAVLTFK